MQYLECYNVQSIVSRELLVSLTSLCKRQLDKTELN